MKSLFLAQWNAFIRYHELGGEGPPLVFLPGLSIPSLVNFLSVVTHDDMIVYHTRLVDYLGSGFSDHPGSFDHSMENHARTVAAILDHEGIKSCTVIGLSMGGTVGIMLATLRPDLVSRLIVGEGNITPGGGSLSRHVACHTEDEWVGEAHAALLKDISAAAIEGDSFAARMSGAWGTADPVGFYRSAVALVEVDPAFKEQFLRLSIPRTFVYGEKALPKNTGHIQADAPDPDELEQRGIHVAVVPDAGHGMDFDNLPGFVDVLKTALMTPGSDKA